jgi:hypothetical protein
MEKLPIASITAAPVPVKIGGVEYLMTPLTDADITALDNWLRARVIRMARSSLTADSTDAEEEMTMRQAFRFASTLTWLSNDGLKLINTLDGLSRLFWQGLRKNHPQVTTDQIRGWIVDQEAMREFTDAFDVANNLLKKNVSDNTLATA